MARGKPDFHRATVIEAKSGTDFIPVVVDASGQMFIALTGQQIEVTNHPSDYFKDGGAVVASGEVGVNNHPSDYFKDGGAVVASGEVGVNNHPADYFKKDEAIGSITANVTVDQQDSDRVLKGTEGANKRYIAVDAAGILLARLKGAFGEVLKDIAVDTSGILLSRLKGAYGEVLKDISVDDAGIMLARLKGAYGEVLKDIYVDSSGKMVARIQAVGGGLEPLFTIDDGGDEDLISDWTEAVDGLAPVDLENFGKEGQHAMKLGVDASLNVADYALWTKAVAIGDMFQFKDMKIYMWVYFNTIDYLTTGSFCIEYRIGSSSSDCAIFSEAKSNLTQGWNLLEFDLTDPDEVLGTVDWTSIDYQRLQLLSVTDNTDDYYAVLDLMAIVKENPETGNLIDVSSDKDGLLLSKLVGSYGELHKPIASDRFGNMRVNINDQLPWGVIANTYKGGLVSTDESRAHPGVELYTLCDLAGPGIIMGGVILHLGIASHKTCNVLVTVDGVSLKALTFENIYNYNLIRPWEFIPHLTFYDNATFEYFCSFPSQLTFATQFKVAINEVVGTDSNSYLYLIHALV